MARPLGSRDKKKRKRRGLGSLDKDDNTSIAKTAAITGVGTASTATVGTELLPKRFLQKLQPRSPTGMSASKKLALGGLALGTAGGATSEFKKRLNGKNKRRYL